jgi:MFS transporter, NNP family, nitrate/nitrite transporter
MARYTSFRGKGLVFLAFLWFVWFTNFSVRTVFSPIMPLIEDEYLISHALASSLFIYAALGYGISLFFSGMFCGHFGYKRSILISIGVSALIFFLIPFVKTFTVLSALVFLLGLSTAIYLPSIIPLITEYYEERYWGRCIAIHDSAASVSIFAIPFVVLACLHFVAWRHIFTLFGIVFVVTGLAFALLSREVKIHKTTMAPLSSFLTNRSLWIMGIVWIFAAGANMGIYYVTPLYLTKELMLDLGYANTIFGLSKIGGVVCVVLSGFIVDRFSLRKTMFAIIFMTGLFTVLMALANIRLMGLALFAQASVIMGFFPLGLVAISRMFDREQRSMATGFIVTLGVIFGIGVVPFLLGVAGDTITFRLGILLFGIVVTLASGLIFFIKDLR